MTQNATSPPSSVEKPQGAFYKQQPDRYRKEGDKLVPKLNAEQPKDGDSNSVPRAQRSGDQIDDLLNLAQASIRRWRKSVDLVNILMNKTGNQDHDSPVDDIATLQTQLAAAKQQITNSHDEVRIVEDDCAKIKARLRTEIEELHKKLKAEKTSNASSTTDGAAALQRQLAIANQQITNLNEEVSKVKDDCAKAKTKFQKEIEKKQKQLEATKAENAKTLQQRDFLQAQIDEVLKTVGIPVSGESALKIAKLVQTPIPDQASEATLRSIAQQLQIHLQPMIKSLDLNPISQIPFRLVASPLNSTSGLDENDSTVYNRQAAAIFASQLQANISRIVNGYSSKDFRNFFGNVLINAGLINRPPRIPPAPKRNYPHPQQPNGYDHDSDSDSDGNGGGGGRTLKLISDDDPLPTTESSDQSNDSDRNGPFSPNIDTPNSETPDAYTPDVGDESETEEDDQASPSIRPASWKARRPAKPRACIPSPIITPRRSILPRSRPHQRAAPVPSSSRSRRSLPPRTPRIDPAILARRKWVSENWKAFPGISPKKDTTSVSVERPLRPGVRQKVADGGAAATAAERKLERAKRSRATARRDERRAIARAKGEGKDGRLRAEAARGRSQRAGETVRHARREARRLKRRAGRLRGGDYDYNSSSSSSPSSFSSTSSDDEGNDQDEDPQTPTPSENPRTPRSKTLSNARSSKSQSTTFRAEPPSTRRSARTAGPTAKVATRTAPGPKERRVGRKRVVIDENEETSSREKKRKI